MIKYPVLKLKYGVDFVFFYINIDCIISIFTSNKTKWICLYYVFVLSVCFCPFADVVPITIVVLTELKITPFKVMKTYAL